jgi:hypothetical protein
LEPIVIIRSGVVDTTRRTLPLDRSTLPRRIVRESPVDSFEPAAPVARQLAVAQSALTSSSSSSSGGFFSNLFKRLKNVAGNLLGQVSTWFSANSGGLIAKATTWVSDFVSSMLTKAGTWVQGILANWTQKLNN